MPLYLRPPRSGKSPNYEIRGTYLGVSVERSAGTPSRSVALRELGKLKTAIERGEWPPAPARASQGEPTFLSAAVSYMQQGGERRMIGPLIRHFGEAALPLSQEAIDQAALALHPNTTAATRNRHVYTPVSAVLRHALGEDAPTVRRPKGAKGKVRTDFLSEADARAVIQAAEPRLAILLQFLLYTGCRLGEALSLTWDDVDLGAGYAYIKHTKNGDPRTVLLRADLRTVLETSRGSGGSIVTETHQLPRLASERAAPRDTVFPFSQGGHLKWKLRRATLKACGIDAPARRPKKYKTPPHRLLWMNFHTFSHTWATWMRRYGGLDVQGLVATGRWRDTRSAARYSHVVSREEWDRVERLPGNMRGKAS